MADLEENMIALETASNGAEMRRPLADIFRFLSEKGRDAKTLSYHDETYFAKQSDMSSLLPLDVLPVRKSKKPVTGGGLFAVIGDLDDFDLGDN